VAQKRSQKYEAIKVAQGNRTFLLCQLPASLLTSVTYAAVRGVDDEPGAVQRILNPRRIASVKEFTLQGGDFPSALVVNWVGEALDFDGHQISILDVPRSAQTIDGQHRIAGIAAAIEEKPAVGALQLPVAIYSGLSTRECADIFLSINTEQKTVSRSLVFDLFGEASESLVDHVALRARDIAMFLHESPESPYNGQIKLPGSPRRRGGVALSTVVGILKPLVDDKGPFEIYELSELEVQRQVILNLFRALLSKFKEDWDSSDNVFLYASGFSAAVRFFQVKLLPACAEKGDFSEAHIAEIVAIERDTFMTQNDLRGLSGGDSISRVYDALVEALRIRGKPGKRKIKI
jgi:DNA sulfur modification protein DndB